MTPQRVYSSKSDARSNCQANLHEHIVPCTVSYTMPEPKTKKVKK